MHVQQLLQPVVTVDNPAVKVVQVGSGETATFQLNHWPQVRRNNRNSFHNHPFRLVAAVSEGIKDVQPADGPGTLLPLQGLQFCLKGSNFLVQVNLLKQVADSFGTHLSHEAVAVLGLFFPVFSFSQ